MAEGSTECLVRCEMLFGRIEMGPAMTRPAAKGGIEFGNRFREYNRAGELTRQYDSWPGVRIYVSCNG